MPGIPAEIFVPHPEGVQEILKGEESVKAMTEAVGVIGANVLHAVPVNTGAYLRSFTPSLRFDVQVDEELGAIGYVGTTFGKWHFVEFGGPLNPGGYHPFGLGVLQAGLQWEPTGAP